MSLYQTLGIDPKATLGEIKAAYRRKSKEAHPDREGGSNDAMASINDAYATLSSQERREQYDRTGSIKQMPTEEDHAIESLCDAFSQCLASNGDIVKEVKQAFTNVIKGCYDDMRRIKLALEKLHKRSGLVTLKSGVNLFQMILEARIADMNRQFDLLEKKSRIANIALDMVKAYSFTGEVEKDNRGGPSFKDCASIFGEY